MRFGPKVVFLLSGLLLGGVVGELTRPEIAEIKIGGTAIEMSNNRVSVGPSGHVTSGRSEHILSYAAIGGIIGLLAGFAAGRR